MSQAGSALVLPESNILQVYAAYDTGLAHGTSVRIKVSPSTSAREVVDLVIKQLNMAVILKGKDRPIYENEKLDNFCLVAVIGSRERCLRDDFRWVYNMYIISFLFFPSFFLLFLSPFFLLLSLFPFYLPFSFFWLRLVIIFFPNPSKAHIL